MSDRVFSKIYSARILDELRRALDVTERRVRFSRAA
jgi:hypothetical protein